MEDAFQISLESPAIEPSEVSPQLQVFQDREGGEDLVRLGHLDEAEGHNLLRPKPAGLRIQENSAPIPGGVQPGDDVQEGRLARPVGSDERDDFAGPRAGSRGGGPESSKKASMFLFLAFLNQPQRAQRTQRNHT
jgi:hypothetical protein